MAGLRFVVTGTGRSGTTYAAQLYRAAGLTCGHEEVFTPRPGWRETAAPRSSLVGRLRQPVGQLREERRRSALRLDGDASWMAAPRLPKVKAHRVLIVRHPILVIRSFMGTRFFSDPTRNRAQRGYALAHMRVVGDDVLDTMRWWAFWNALAADHADTVLRLEDLDADRFASLLSSIGEPSPARRAAAAVESTPPDTNSSERRGDSRGDLEFDDLPRGADRDALAAAARRFGYEL